MDWGWPFQIPNVAARAGFPQPLNAPDIPLGGGPGASAPFPHPLAPATQAFPTTSPPMQSLFDQGLDIAGSASQPSDPQSLDALGSTVAGILKPQTGTLASVDNPGKISPRVDPGNMPFDPIGSTLKGVDYFDNWMNEKTFNYRSPIAGLLESKFGIGGAQASDTPPAKTPFQEYMDSQGGPIKGDDKVQPPKSAGKGGPGLTRSGGGSSTTSFDLGTYNDPAPAPHRLVDQAPDYSNVLDELDKSKPQDIKQTEPRWQAGLSGLLQGLAQASQGSSFGKHGQRAGATLGQLLLGAGLGTLQGQEDYDREGRRLDQRNQAAQSEFHRQMAESLLSQDQAKQNWQSKANDTLFQNDAADYSRNEQIRKDMEPKFDLTSSGLSIERVDPATGKRTFTLDTAPADRAMDRQFDLQRRLLQMRLDARGSSGVSDPVPGILGIGGGKRDIAAEVGLAIARNPGLAAQVFGDKAPILGQQLNSLIGKDSSFHSTMGYMKGKSGEAQQGAYGQAAAANFWRDQLNSNPDAQRIALKILGVGNG